MPRESKELPDAVIRKLRHGTNKKGELCKRPHAVGGVTGLYLQCMPPVVNEKIESRQWIQHTLSSCSCLNNSSGHTRHKSFTRRFNLSEKGINTLIVWTCIKSFSKFLRNKVALAGISSS